MKHFRSAKTADKRILLFTNEDDPFGSVKGAAKTDMTRTTLQRAKVTVAFLWAIQLQFYDQDATWGIFVTVQDAQDLGISIELLPFSRPNEEFDASLFYAVSWCGLLLSFLTSTGWHYHEIIVMPIPGITWIRRWWPYSVYAISCREVSFYSYTFPTFLALGWNWKNFVDQLPKVSFASGKILGTT